MITTHKNNLINRCQERGYNLSDVMPCVVRKEGDIWTIDETHEKYPKLKIDLSNLQIKNKNANIGAGVGTELKKLLSFFGIKATNKCSCNARAKIMNEKGINWCKINKNTILSWLKEESEKRGIPFFKFAASRLLNLAIKRAEEKQL